ncbi:MAG: 1-aminocyclopropane-1-carboxylate deaminase, partial [Chitinophagales bacterium]
EEGIQGAGEILKLVDAKLYTHLICAVGSGTTFRGLSRGLNSSQSIIGIPVLKGIDSQMLVVPDEGNLAAGVDRKLIQDYHFGGYAKRNLELFRFMNDFYARTAIPLDFVYTAKLIYALFDLADKGYFFEGSRILVIHSGGLQGNQSLRKGVLAF